MKNLKFLAATIPVVLFSLLGQAFATTSPFQNETLKNLLRSEAWPKHGTTDILRCNEAVAGTFNGERLLLQFSSGEAWSPVLKPSSLNIPTTFKFSDDCRFLAIRAFGKVPSILDLSNRSHRELPTEAGILSHFQFADSKLLYLVDNGLSVSWSNNRNTPNKILSVDLSTFQQKAVFEYDSMESFKKTANKQILFTTSKRIQSGQEINTEITFYRLKLNQTSSPEKLYQVSRPFNVDSAILSDEVATVTYRKSPSSTANDGVDVISLNEKRIKLSIPHAGKVVTASAGNFGFSKEDGAGESELFIYNSEQNNIAKLNTRLPLGGQRILDISRDSYLTVHWNTLVDISISEVKVGSSTESLYLRSKLHPSYTIQKRQILGEDNPILNYAFVPSGNVRGVVMFVHGGGCFTNVTSSPASTAPEEMVHMLNAGYAVYAANYANARYINPAYNKTLNREECGRDDIANLNAAEKDIAKLFPGKPLILWGHSQGAYLVHLATTLYADDFKVAGVVAVAGPTEYDTAVAPLKLYSKFYDPKRMPIDYLSKLNVPLLLYHGMGDYKVSLSHGTHYAERAINLGKRVETVFNGKGHTPTAADGAEFEQWLSTLTKFLHRVSGS